MAHRASRIPRLIWIGGAALAAATAAVLFLFDPAAHGFYPSCMFHRTTGLLCPGCGSLRALYHLLHGHLATAFRFNPLLITALALGLLWWPAAWIRRRCNAQGDARISLGYLWAFLALAILFCVWRNLPGMPFAGVPQ
jgi:hypothetical protein